MTHGACNRCGNAHAECECRCDLSAEEWGRLHEVITDPPPAPRWLQDAVRGETPKQIADHLWERVSVDTIPPRAPTPRELQDRANEAIVELLLNRPSFESVRTVQEVARLLKEKIR